MDKDTFLNIVKPYTMTTEVRIKSLFDSLEHIRINNLDGDLVECGVWQGGNILGIISYLDYYKIHRKIWLYDTFEGMVKPTSYDVDYNNNNGEEWIGKCSADLEFVKKHVISKSHYPKELIHYIKGDICQTLLDEQNVPDKISLLRLDTDWYLSTKLELEVLYPMVIKNGIIIIDDYGHWMGCKKAVDEYFEENFNKEYIDYTCIKIEKLK